MQTKKQSAIESISNVGSGMVIAFTVSQIAALLAPHIPGFEWHVGAGSNVVMTMILTTISVIRGFYWRRYFNKLHNDPHLCSTCSRRTRKRKDIII